MFFISFIEPLWLVLILTLTGGLVVGFGVKRQYLLLRLVGVVLQLSSIYIFANLVWYPFSASLGKNYYFLTCILFVVTALSSAYKVEKLLPKRLKMWDRVCLFTLFLLGIASWYVGVIREVYAHIVVFERLSGVLLMVSVTSILVGLLSEYIEWDTLGYYLFLQLPAMIGILLFRHFTEGATYSMLTGWGTTVWPITFFIQYRALAVLDHTPCRKFVLSYHLASLWLLFYFCYFEIGLVMEPLREVYSLPGRFVQPLFTLVVIGTIVTLQKWKIWPVRVFPNAYLFGGCLGIIMISSLSFFS